jgi:hypothetical protein
MKFVWSDGGIKLTGENRSTRRKTNPTWTDLGPNSRLSGEKSAIDHLSHGAAKRSVDRLQLYPSAATVTHATAHKVLVASANSHF